MTLNEEEFLQECLGGLSFCDEILVIDLGSTDASATIARAAGARVVSHPRRPVVEQIWPEVFPLAKHDWIVLVDPDEIVPPQLARDVSAVIRHDDASVGLVDVPRRFHFKGRPLYKGFWGHIDRRMCVVHRDRVQLRPKVHDGIKVVEPYERIALPARPGGEIRHHWATGWGQLLRKHLRYVPHEGQARHGEGQRFEWTEMFHHVRKTWQRDLREFGARQEGLLGLQLAVFHAAYEAACWLSLGWYQRRTRQAEDA